MSQMKKGSTVAGMPLWHSGNMRLLFEVARAQGLINDKSVTGDWLFNGAELLYQDTQRVIGLTSTRIELNGGSQFLGGVKSFGDFTMEKVPTAPNVGIKVEHLDHYGLEFRDGNVNISGTGGELRLGYNSPECATTKVLASTDVYTEDGNTLILGADGKLYDLGERVFSPSNPPPIVAGSNRLTNSGYGSGEGGKLTIKENINEVPVQSWTMQFDNFEMNVKGTLPPGVIDNNNALLSIQRHRSLDYQLQLAFVGDGGIHYRPTMMSAWDQIVTQSLGNKLYSNLTGSYEVDFFLNSLQLNSHETSATKFLTEIRENGTDVIIKSDNATDTLSLRIGGVEGLNLSKDKLVVNNTLESNRFLYKGKEIGEIYLGINATAVNSDKLGNVEYSRYKRNDTKFSELVPIPSVEWWTNSGCGNSYYINSGAGSSSAGYVHKIGGKDNSVWLAVDESGEFSVGLSEGINTVPNWKLMLSRANAERDFLGIRAKAVNSADSEKLGGKTPAQIQADYDERFLGIGAKAVSAADADKLGGLLPREYGRAVIIPQVVGRTLNTAEFVQYLSGIGAFNHNFWVGRASWSYDNNHSVNTGDADVGSFRLAGSVIEVVNQDSSRYTIRITLASTSSSSGFKSGCTVVFSDNGTGDAEGWRVEYSSKNKPTVADIADAVRKSGDTELGNMTYKAGHGPSGVLVHSGGYLTINPYNNSYGAEGSRFRGYFKLHDSNKPDVLNPGLVFSAHNTDGSAVNMNIWLNGKKVYHEGNKPTASELGLLKNTTDTLNGGLIVAGTSSHITIRETDASNKEWVLEGQNGDFCLTERGVATRLRATAGGEFSLNGTLSVIGAVSSSNGNSYRISTGSSQSHVASFFRNDNTKFYLMLTDPGSADGWTWNSLRPLTVDVITGDVILGHKVEVKGALQLNTTLDHSNLTHSNKQVLNADANSVYLGSRDGVANIHLQTSTGQVMVSHGSNNHRVYHQGYKPTFTDVGAIAANNGSASGTLSIAGTVLPKVNPTTNAKDYATGLYAFDTAATEVAGHSPYSTIFGINLQGSTRHAQLEFHNDGVTARFRAAHSSASSSTEWRDWNTLYHTGNKPTPADIGSLASTGGVLTGGLTINSANDGQITLNSTDSSHVYTIYKHNNVTRGYLGIDNDANLVYASYDSTGTRVSGYGLSINPTTHAVTLNGDLNLLGSSKRIKTAGDVTIIRDYGNGNVTLSASKNSSGVAGDLYLGYSTEGHWTRSVRLESKMDWKASHNIISEAGLINSDKMYGDVARVYRIRNGNKSTSEQDQIDVIIGDETNRGGAIILGAGESLAKLKSFHPYGSQESVILGGDSSAGVVMYTGLQLATSAMTEADVGRVTIQDGGVRVYGKRSSNSDWSKYAHLNVGTDDIVIHNSKSNKYLQLKDNGVLSYSGNAIYHAGNKPTASDVGALPINGGVLSSHLQVNGTLNTSISGFGFRTTVSDNTVYIQGGKVDSDENNQIVVISGYNGKPLTSFEILTKGHGIATINGSKVYTESYLPTTAALGAVPTSRKVNGKTLNADITLVASDVGTYTSSEIDSKIGNNGFKTVIINKPAGVLDSKYYPIVVSGAEPGILNDVKIRTKSSSGSDPMNCSRFDGQVDAGGWSDMGSNARGNYVRYDAAERSLHSLWCNNESSGVYAFYVEARAFPLQIRVPVACNVICTGQNISSGTSTYNAALVNPDEGAGTKIQRLLSFGDTNRYFNTSRDYSVAYEVNGCGMLQSRNSFATNLESNNHLIMSAGSNGVDSGLREAYMCVNAYWDGAWKKYNNAQTSRSLSIVSSGILFTTSDAGNSNPHQKTYAVYHQGFKPTATDVGLGYVVNKGWNYEAVADTYAIRDSNSDLSCRLVKSTYADESYMGGGLVFRQNNSSDNYLRTCTNTTAVRNWLGIGNSHDVTFNRVNAGNDLWLVGDKRRHITFVGANGVADGYIFKDLNGALIFQCNGRKLTFNTNGALVVDRPVASEASFNACPSGSAWTEWQNVGAALQVDTPESATSAHTIWRATRWGARHLAAMAVHDANDSTVVSLHCGGTNTFMFSQNGDFNANGNGNFNNVYIRSDDRLKINREEITDYRKMVRGFEIGAYDKMQSLDDNTIKGREIGIYASSLKKQHELLVHENEDTTLHAMVYAITAVNSGAIQELDSELESLKSENESLKSELDEMKDRMKKLEELVSKLL